MEFSLTDKYLKEEGTIILTGVQALVRIPLDQHRADSRAGLKTAAFISGYRGSPVGGLDFLLEANKPILDQHDVVFMPGINEDLGATAVWGSQMANLMPKPKYDGVLGMWYGKAPGVDRSGDVFKHANFFGVGRYGGVLAVAGDDPVAKSSTLPAGSEIALYDANMPILYPGSVEEVIRFGRYGFELSRYSGLWTGFKIVTNIADAFTTAQVAPVENIVRPAFDWNGRPWQPMQNAALVAPHSVALEQEIHEGRLLAAARFGAANQLNQITVRSGDDRIGIIAPGKTYVDVREALYHVGLDERALQANGIRLLKIGLVSPIDPETIRDFARGLEQIIVIEEKRAFIELFVRDALYSLVNRPQVLGKQDETGRTLVPAYGELNADVLAGLLHRLLAPQVKELKPPYSPPTVALDLLNVPLAARRTPYYCSGCPHNRSTNVPDGSLAGGGIGCHGMVLTMDRNTWGITHMGGEGAQWVGASFFSDTEHLFQNLGDGTLFHSGYLAIRQATAAKTTITYKILYNTAVAMTGGQAVDGGMPVPELTQALKAEGVGHIIVCADDTSKYAGDVSWPPGVDVWPRERLDEAQEVLRDTPGVTILIYDQACAADLRRKRRRGQAPDPPMRVVINEAVCEGCGDCGVKSNCLSVFPVDTEFGRKTQIHQSSCNKDYTCLEGDCPAFITVMPGSSQDKAAAPQKMLPALPDMANLPEPPALPDEANIYMTGIGGTGVVTINQVLATAAMIAGKPAYSLDQTGLSQKGGPVVSHLRILSDDRTVATMIGQGQADAYLVFDILTATTDENLSHADPERTVAIVSSSELPTGQMVSNKDIAFPRADMLLGRLDRATRSADNIYFDAIATAEALFGSHMMGNMLVVGAAYQKGLLPFNAAAIEEAISHNGVAVKKNVQAFRFGRLLVAQPERALALSAPTEALSTALVAPLSPEAQRLVDQVGAEGELRRLLEIRVPQLIAYQDEAYAARYAEFVGQTLQTELSLGTTTTPLSEAVARYLFKLMAYKDEYEVARLSLDPAFKASLKDQFGPDASFTYQLHPPFLRALGMEKKIGLGEWFDSFYKLLYSMRRLRFTPFDIFGMAHVRKVERALIDEYQAMIEEELAGLSPTTHKRAVRLAELPDMVRGYEHIKMANVAQYRAAIDEIRAGSAQIGVTFID